MYNYFKSNHLVLSMDTNIKLHAAMDLIEAYTEEEISSLKKAFTQSFLIRPFNI